MKGGKVFSSRYLLVESNASMRPPFMKGGKARNRSFITRQSKLQ